MLSQSFSPNPTDAMRVEVMEGFMREKATMMWLYPYINTEEVNPLLLFLSPLYSTLLIAALLPPSLPLLLSLSFCLDTVGACVTSPVLKCTVGITLRAPSLLPPLLIPPQPSPPVEVPSHWYQHILCFTPAPRAARRTERLRRNSHKWISNEMFVTAHLGLCSGLTLRDSHHSLTFGSWGVAVAPFASGIFILFYFFFNKGYGATKEETAEWSMCSDADVRLVCSVTNQTFLLAERLFQCR